MNFKINDLIFNGSNLVCKVTGLAGNQYGLPYELKAKYVCHLSGNIFYHDSTEFLIVSTDQVTKITDQKTIDQINKIIIFKN